MKKNFFRMFAAILFCGTIATVFTACSKDDDSSKSLPQEQGGQGQPGGQKATKGDVTLTFVAQPKSLQFFEYDFKYVDAKGNTKTIDIDQNTTSSGSLDDLELGFLKETINAFAAIPEYSDIKNPFIYRVVIKDQPVGGKVTYTTTCHVKEIPSISETLQYLTPMVVPSLKLENRGREVTSSIIDFKSFKISPEKWADYVKTIEGKEIAQASGTVSVEN